MYLCFISIICGSVWKKILDHVGILAIYAARVSFNPFEKFGNLLCSPFNASDRTHILRQFRFWKHGNRSWNKLKLQGNYCSRWKNCQNSWCNRRSNNDRRLMMIIFFFFTNDARRSPLCMLIFLRYGARNSLGISFLGWLGSGILIFSFFVMVLALLFLLAVTLGLLDGLKSKNCWTFPRPDSKLNATNFNSLEIIFSRRLSLCFLHCGWTFDLISYHPTREIVKDWSCIIWDKRERRWRIFNNLYRRGCGRDRESRLISIIVVVINIIA